MCRYEVPRPLELFHQHKVKDESSLQDSILYWLDLPSLSSPYLPLPPQTVLLRLNLGVASKKRWRVKEIRAHVVKPLDLTINGPLEEFEDFYDLYAPWCYILRLSILRNLLPTCW